MQHGPSSVLTASETFSPQLKPITPVNKPKFILSSQISPLPQHKSTHHFMSCRFNLPCVSFDVHITLSSADLSVGPWCVGARLTGSDRCLGCVLRRLQHPGELLRRRSSPLLRAALLWVSARSAAYLKNQSRVLVHQRKE